MTKAQEYREFAAECVLLSENAATLEDRVRLLTMAARWQSLADAAERSGDETPPEVVISDLRRVASRFN